MVFYHTPLGPPFIFHHNWTPVTGATILYHTIYQIYGSVCAIAFIILAFNVRTNEIINSINCIIKSHNHIYLHKLFHGTRKPFWGCLHQGFIPRIQENPSGVVYTKDYAKDLIKPFTGCLHQGLCLSAFLNLLQSSKYPAGRTK